MSPNNAAPLPQDDAPSEQKAVKRAFRSLVVGGAHFLTPAVEKALEAEGNLVLTADSAKSALEKTRQFQPGLIFLYLGSDAPQELELLGELLIEQASAAVVVVAGKPSIVQAVDAIKLGALDYFELPLEPKKVSELIASQQTWFKEAAPTEG